LLGKKVKKSGGQEIAGINTWVAKENLVIVLYANEFDIEKDKNIGSENIKKEDMPLVHIPV
jgi:hypothetical protein